MRLALYIQMDGKRYPRLGILCNSLWPIKECLFVFHFYLLLSFLSCILLVVLIFCSLVLIFQYMGKELEIREHKWD